MVTDRVGDSQPVAVGEHVRGDRVGEGVLGVGVDVHLHHAVVDGVGDLLGQRAGAAVERSLRRWTAWSSAPASMWPPRRTGCGPEWTDSVSSVRPLDAGPLAVGSRVEISQPRIPTGTYTVTALEPGSAFTWEQRQPGSTVCAHHECAPLPDGGTRVELRVVMSGAVGGVVGRLYRKLTERYLAMEAAGLKACAEGIAH
jgi:hypothetical protein